MQKHLPTYPLLGPDGKEPPPPPEEGELRQYLRTLPEEVVYRLLAVVKLAWGNYPVEEFEAHLSDLKREVKFQDAIERLVMTTYLTADLFDGLTALRPQGVNLDALQFTPA